VKVREIVKLLESNQWRQVRQKGGHRSFNHPSRPMIFMKRYAVVFEKAEKNWAAYVPDLPGCITTGKTLDQTKRNMREAIELHLEAMREVGEAIPEPTSEVDFVDAVA
jgi:predicted RNase H-like HicB family nuclease